MLVGEQDIRALNAQDMLRYLEAKQSEVDPFIPAGALALVAEHLQTAINKGSANDLSSDDWSWIDVAARNFLPSLETDQELVGVEINKADGTIFVTYTGSKIKKDF